MDREGTVVCLLCRGMISFKSGDKARFESHLQHEHEAYFGLDVLLAVSFIREDERKALVKAIAVGYNQSSQPGRRVDIKAVLSSNRKGRTSKTFASFESGDTGSSDCSFEDNDKIYGVPEPVLNCAQCPRTFINIFSLRRHENLHREQNYSCNKCGQRFSFLEDLKAHKSVHEERSFSEDMYVAKDCFETPAAADWTRNNESQATEHQNSYVRCKICLKVMKKDSYPEHKAHHNDLKNQCRFCSRKFLKQEQLMKHLQRCQRNHISKTSLLSYTNLQRTHSCQVCAKNFQSEDNLKSHQALHYPVQEPTSYKENVSDLSADDVVSNKGDDQENYYIPMN